MLPHISSLQKACFQSGSNYLHSFLTNMPKAARPHHARHRKYTCLHGHIYPLLFRPAHHIGKHGTDICKAYSLAEFFVCVLLMIGVQPSTCTNETIIRQPEKDMMEQLLVSIPARCQYSMQMTHTVVCSQDATRLHCTESGAEKRPRGPYSQPKDCGSTLSVGLSCRKTVF